MAAGGERIPLMRVLLLTLDRCARMWRNGQYSRIICSTLNAAGSAVLLVCGRPKASPERFPFPHDRTLFQGVTVPVPRWFKHDRGCAHEEYCAGVEAAGEAITAFGPDVVVAVDWVGSLAHRRIWHLIPSVPVVWLNFRVFHTSHNIPPEDIPFYQEAEAVACRAASHAVALCRMDATALASNAGTSNLVVLLPPIPAWCEAKARAWRPPPPPPAPPVPAPPPPPAAPRPGEDGGAEEDRLEGDAPPGAGEGVPQLPPDRPYLLCCVRRSPEKNVDFFVRLCQRASALLDSLGVVPLLCGATADESYDAGLRGGLLAACRRAEIRGSLSHDELMDVYSKTLLNVHTALYEPYGLTIVEAAAFGAPSLIHRGGQVGATDLLRPGPASGWGEGAADAEEEEEGFETDMADLETCAQAIRPG
eukprot:tig00000806_g4363.t1